MARLAALAAGGRGGSGEGGEGGDGGEGGGAFDGVIGFSQGAAMALLVPGARWAVLLSAIPPPRGRGPSTGRRDARPSLHVYDAAEPHAHLCRRVEASFEGPAVVRHGEGHAVPRAEAATREMVRFVERV